MSSKSVNVSLVKVTFESPNPAPFDSPLIFRLVLNISGNPPEKLFLASFTWAPIWYTSVDQELDSFEFGPFLTCGQHEILLECSPPDVTLIPDPTGPTALMLSVTYNNAEFLHMGWNVNVLCDGELPDVFTDSKLLSRNLGRRYSKITPLSLDQDVNDDSKDNDALDSSTLDIPHAHDILNTSSFFEDGSENNRSQNNTSHLSVSNSQTVPNNVSQTAIENFLGSTYSRGKVNEYAATKSLSIQDFSEPETQLSCGNSSQNPMLCTEQNHRKDVISSTSTKDISLVTEVRERLKKSRIE